MYKVLIAEDEVPVRNRIIESIAWESIGLEVAYAAGDGQEALDYLEEHQVDLILTDIYMPFVDGMELIRRVRETNNYCKVVFLTGYNEFDYAKEAIELHASRYILKPITKAELTELLIELKEELDAAIIAKKNLNMLEGEYRKNLIFLRDKLLYDIVAGFMPSDRIEQAFENLKFEFKKPFYRLGVLEVIGKEDFGQKVWADDYSLLHFAMYNICKEILSEEDMTRVLLGENGKIIIIFTKEEALDFDKKAFDLLTEVLNTVRHIYEMPLTAGLSSTYNTIGDLNYAYEEALSAISYNVIEGYNRVIITSDIEPVTPKNHQKIEDTMMKIAGAMKVNDLGDAKELLSLFFEQIRFSRYGLNEVKTLILSMIIRIYDVYNQMCLKDTLKATLDFRLVEQLYDLEDFSGVQTKLMTTIEDLSGKLKKSREDDKNHLVIEAIAYIELSYMNPTLDLKEMSEKLHVSTSYFSRIFKQAKEQTFLEYLTAHRMNQARTLLKTTDMKVYEISVQIGYDDPHYFSYNFRKNVGMTPLQYRKA